MPIVKKAAKVSGGKTMVKTGGIAGKGVVTPPGAGQRFIQFYYSISTVGDRNSPEILKFNGNVPIGPVGGPPHFPQAVAHALSEELHAEISFRAAR